ncbi:MAG: cytochrome P450 [Nannocystaceae bacterium]
MRLYPPAWAIGREVITPFELRGWSLEPGDQLLMPQWLVHRDPRWFTAPRTFAPERWGEGSRGMARPKMSYFPFGGGARVCIGQHFAMVEGTLALAGLCRRIQVHTVHEREVPLLAGITLRPTAPIHVRCTPW